MEGKEFGNAGQAYVAKLNYLMEKTEDRAQRFNLKRRLENVVAARELAGMEHSAETDWFHLAHNKKGNKNVAACCISRE